MPAPRKKYKFTLSDATIALLMAARIHKKPEAVRKTAKRIYTRTDSHTRSILQMVLQSKDPIALMDLFLEELDL